ncbi:Hypothetical_protein [Hexamita inflata]|uniref:Hypothetical_protein n=1 Tax=Hexamita inflata TaxID=28002 RepID=A0AA86NDS1_9EUKA|nr:Hypothetical protein HINF_LOCUS4864 [Hexamita inflata]
MLLRSIEKYLGIDRCHFLNRNVNEQYLNKTAKKQISQLHIKNEFVSEILKKFRNKLDTHQQRVYRAQMLRNETFNIKLTFLIDNAEKALKELEIKMKRGRKQFIAHNRSIFFVGKISKYKEKLRSYGDITQISPGVEQLKITTSEKFVDKINKFFAEYNQSKTSKLQQIKTTVISGENTIVLIEEKLNVKRELFMHKKPSITTTKDGMEVLSFWVKSQYYEQIQQFVNLCNIKEQPIQKQKKWAFKDQK